jgi:plastocyanin
MNIKCLSLIACIGSLLCGTAGAQGGPVSPPRTGATHGVSKQYEQGDSFPVYSTHTVQVGNATPYYDPPEITVAAGDLVNWVNNQLSDTHTIINGSGHFESAPVPAQKNFCHHFVEEGDYEYSCRFHPWMKGVVHVRRRDLPLEPVQASNSQEAEMMQRAGYLLRNSGAVEAAAGGYWIQDARPGILEYRNPMHQRSELFPIPGVLQVIKPVAAMGGHVIGAVPGFLLNIDIQARKVLNRVPLPKGFSAARAAAVSDKELWVSDGRGEALLFVDLEKESARIRPLPAGSRVITISQLDHAVWALDSGRKLLLKLGTEWINEVPLPREIQHPSSFALDADGRPWFVDSQQRIAGTVLANGMVQKFTVPQAAGVELLQLSDIHTILLADSRESRFSRITFTQASAAAGSPSSSECPSSIAAEDAARPTTSQARTNQ